MTRPDLAALLLCSGVLSDLSELSRGPVKEHLKSVQERIEVIAVKYLGKGKKEKK